MVRASSVRVPEARSFNIKSSPTGESAPQRTNNHFLERPILGGRSGGKHGSGGALPPLPTPAKRLLSAAIIRLASSEAGLQTNCKPVRSRFVGDGLLCRDRLLM